MNPIDLTATTPRAELRRAVIRARVQRVPIRRLGMPELGALLTYTDRDSYLAWVAAWKADYRDLSAQIRQAKADCRETQRAGELNASTLQVALDDARQVAHAMLVLRHLGKADSWTRRNAARQEVS